MFAKYVLSWAEIGFVLLKLCPIQEQKQLLFYTFSKTKENASFQWP